MKTENTNLQDYFDRTYCINLDKRKDRWGECIVEFDKWGISGVTRYSAVDGTTFDRSKIPSRLKNGELGLVITNLDIIKDCMDNDCGDILILEDDVVFNDEILKISEYMSELPEDWDILYFGGNHNAHMGAAPPTKVNDKVCKLHNTFTTHCIGINKRMFKTIIDLLHKYDNPIDVAYSVLQKTHNIYSFYPAIATQRVGFSDIMNSNMDYRWLIK